MSGPDAGARASTDAAARAPRPRTVECVVVGGGPAGLAAARAAATAGLQVVLVDENAELGGQYYRQMPATFRSSGARETVEGRRLIDEVRELGVEVQLGAVAWGIFDQRTVAIATADASSSLAAETLVLAPGAYDRPVPFPGWTLPGVITAGGAQNLMKAYGVVPGRRVVLAGSGPLLLVVAHYLLQGGAEIRAIAEVSPMRGLWRYAARLLPHLDFVQQGYRLRREIADAGVPFLPGHVVRRALGDSEVTGVVLSPCDDQWAPIAGIEQTFEADTLIAGYGFVSSLELGRLAGCEHEWNDALGGFVPVRGRDLESTVPAVYIVGDGAGVAGSAVARAEGALAGLAAAQRLGRAGGRAHALEMSRARGRLRHLAGFRRVMDELYRFGAGIYTLADAETTLCRCEEVSVLEALQATREGATHVNEVKAWTRVGMGRCQGRMCGPALAHVIARATGRPVTEAGVFSPRPPAKPVPLAALAHPG